MARRKTVLLPKPIELQGSHLVYARLETPHGIVKPVLSEIFLPERGREAIELHFHPTVRQAEILQYSPSFYLTARGRTAGQGFTVRSGQIWSDRVAAGVRDGIGFITDFRGRPDWLEIRFGTSRRKNNRV